MCDNVIIFYIKFFAFSKNRAILNTEKCRCISMKQMRKIIYALRITIKIPRVYITTQEDQKNGIRSIKKRYGCSYESQR